jgi:hypothetical protein
MLLLHNITDILPITHMAPLHVCPHNVLLCPKFSTTSFCNLLAPLPPSQKEQQQLQQCVYFGTVKKAFCSILFCDGGQINDALASITKEGPNKKFEKKLQLLEVPTIH